MNEEYLQGLHEHLGVKADYNTWVNNIQNNEEYLAEMHEHLNVKANYDTWKKNVFGSPVIAPQEDYADSLADEVSEEPTPEGTTVTEDVTVSNGEESSTVIPIIEESGLDVGTLNLPETTEQASVNLLAITNNITKNHVKVKKKLAEQYFNLDNFKQSRTKRFGSGLGSQGYIKSEEEDLQSWFGEEKYKQYLEYQKNPKMFNAEWVDDAVVEEAVDRTTQEEIEQYVTRIDNEELKANTKTMFDEGINNVFGPEDVDFAQQYMEALKLDKAKDQEIKRLNKGFGSSEAGKKVMEIKATGKESEKVMAKYFNSKYLDYSKKSKAWKEDFNKLEGINQKYQTEINSVNTELEALGEVDEYSSAEKITKYNELAAKGNDLLQKYNIDIKKSGLDPKEINQRATNLRTGFDRVVKNYDKVKDVATISKALALDYSMTSNMLLSIETGLSEMKQYGLYGLKGVAWLSDKLSGSVDAIIKPYGKLSDVDWTGKIDEKTGKKVYKDSDPNFMNFWRKEYKASIDYNESLQNYKQSALPLNIDWSDADMDNIGDYSAQLLGNNIFSIATALSYGGAIKMGMNVPRATKVLSSTFFGLEGGAKLTHMEIDQKNAAENITGLQASLELATTPDERMNILNQIDYYDRALKATESDKAFSSILYGSIAMYAERLGTMRYMRNLALAAPATGRLTFGNAIKGSKTFGMNTGIEYVEEFATQVGHNIVDNEVLGDNKSLASGIDANFNANVIFSTFAIQAPSASMNVINTVRSELSTQIEIGKNRTRRNDLIEINNELLADQESGFKLLDTEYRKYLESESKRIVREAALVDSYTFAEIANMNPGEIKQMFELNQKKRDALNEIKNLGVSSAVESPGDSYITKQKKKLTNKIKELNGKRDQLRGKPSERRKEIIENVLEKDKIQVDTEFYLGKYQGAVNIVKGLAGKVNQFGKVINGQLDLTDLEQYLDKKLENGKITKAQKNEYLKGFKSGNYASFLGNEVILVDANVINAINSAETSLEKSIAAYAPIHELQHINDISTGLVQDLNVVSSQRAAVKGIQNEIELLFRQDKIKEKDYLVVKNRINSYARDNSGSVDLMELLTIAGELKNAGILNENSIDPLLSLKLMINQLSNKYFKKGSMFFKLNNSGDVLGYIDSFQRSTRAQRLVLGPEEEVKIPKFSKVSPKAKEFLETKIDGELVYTNESLVDIINAKSSSQENRFAAVEALIEKNWPVISKSLKFNLSGDITMESIKTAISEQMLGIFPEITLPNGQTVNREGKLLLNTYNKENAVTTFLDVTIGPRQAEIFTRAKMIDAETKGVSLDEAKNIAVSTELENATSNQKDTRKRVNVLKIPKVARVAKEIRQDTKVVEGDTHKQVTKNNEGHIGNKIFNIPENKITKPNQNLTTSDDIVSIETGEVITKEELDAGATGILSPSESKSVQDVFADYETSEQFLKILPKTNVSEKDALINEIGENIPVSRNVYGRAIGLQDRILEYFYKPLFKPSGGRARSQGKTSQVPLWTLKEEFINPKKDVIVQLQKDLGITERKQINILPTNEKRSEIGQLLKGAARTLSQQVSLSAAQRILEAKGASPQQIADVTSGQRKTAFSAAVTPKTKEISEYVGEIIKGDYVKNKLEALGQEAIPKGELLLEITENGEVIEGREYSARLMQTLVPGQKYTWETSLSNAVASFLNGHPKYYNMFKLSFTGSITRTAYGAQANFEQSIKKALNNIGKKSLKEIENTEQVDPKRNYYNIALTKDQKKKGLKGKRQRADIGTRDDSIDQNKVKNLINFYRDMSRYLKENKKDTWMLQEFILHGSMDQSNFGRMSAFFLGYAINEKGKIILNESVVEEHSPQAEVMRMLAGAAIDNRVDEVAPLIESLFSQISILERDDPGGKLKSSNGIDFFTKVAPQIINGNLSWLPKGYASIYRLMKAGVNPNNYVLKPEKQTIAKYFNVNNLNVEEAQQTIIDIFEGNKDIKFSKAQSKVTFSKDINSYNKLNNTIDIARTIKFSEISRGITVLDFDDTLATTKSLVKYTTPDGKTGTLNAEQYASTYEDLLGQGYTFDFSDFNKVVKGKIAPLFQKAIKLQGKFGPENMFVLTARPPTAAKAIFDFLKANGLNIPIKNITGLANSTAEAKALWMANKVGEGYNDFYFADDALQNVQAVNNMLEQFDVKRKVQQAKVKFSKNMNTDFNNILEEVTGIESKKRFAATKARKRGADKGKFRFFIPPSHEDFVGLLYNFMGKGRQGDGHRDFFEKALVRPLNRANREYDTARQSIANDYKALNKQFPNVKNKLTKKTPDGDFTFQDAIRVHLWNKHSHNIPGLSEIDQANLSELVMADAELQAYAETLNIISKQDAYVNPTEGWESGDIRVDLDDATGRVGRGEFFAEFNESSDIIFSEENLNKIEAGYGKGVREALEDMLYRIKTGRNRPSGQNRIVNAFMNYLNGSVGTVMFFNMRSALLQQMSIVNYINFADNNVFAAAKAFANQKQYWKDFAFIFNSDMLKQRRGGIQTDVNGAELAESLRNSKNPTRKLVSKLLEIGFLPTQIGDNIAIATGGAPYYRNKINTYLKQGMTQKDAEAAAFTDFQNITQSTQQSARPDMVSQQQASVIGKVILNFQNVTSQFNRLGKKAFLDIKNRRITKPNTTQTQSDISNAARITYYFAVQNAIFYTLQTALFAMLFDDDEEDDNKLFLKKKERLINGSIDSVLRGSGVLGAVVATLKNTAIAFARQRDVRYNPDESAVLMEALNLSPVVGIKGRKITNAEKTLNYNKNIIEEMETFDIDNPQWSAATNYVEMATNVPLNRLYNKTQNVRQALNNDHSTWERTLMFLGWSQYNLNVENKKMDEIKATVKEKKKIESKERAKIKREEKKKIDLKEKEAKGIEKQKQEKKKGEQVTCLVCKLPIEKGKKYCTIHEKAEQRKDGEKRQCRKRKADGKRCGMQTASKSGYCYYHD